MNDFMQYLQSKQSDDMVGEPIGNVEHLISEMPEALSVTELNLLVGFASRQVGIWDAEWMYSPAAAPLLAAKAESEGWARLLQSWIVRLSELAPDVKGQLESAHHSTLLKCHMSKSVDYCNGKPLAKLISVCQARLAITLNKLGVPGLAEHLYMMAMYPKGTVGRGA